MVVSQRGRMPQLTTHLAIDAPAGQVWQVIGPGFARIGDWATTIPASAAIPASAPAAATPVAYRAPVLGRTCRAGTRLVPDITETLTDYDEDRRTLTYQAGGLPAFITSARSTWTVTPAGEAACQVTVTGRFQTRGVLGLVGCWAILAQAPACRPASSSRPEPLRQARRPLPPQAAPACPGPVTRAAGPWATGHDVIGGGAGRARSGREAR
jgi:hypothetical protein